MIIISDFTGVDERSSLDELDLLGDPAKSVRIEEITVLTTMRCKVAYVSGYRA